MMKVKFGIAEQTVPIAVVGVAFDIFCVMFKLGMNHKNHTFSDHISASVQRKMKWISPKGPLRLLKNTDWAAFLMQIIGDLFLEICYF